MKQDEEWLQEAMASLMYLPYIAGYNWLINLLIICVEFRVYVWRRHALANK